MWTCFHPCGNHASGTHTRQVCRIRPMIGDIRVCLVAPRLHFHTSGSVETRSQYHHGLGSQSLRSFLLFSGSSASHHACGWWGVHLLSVGPDPAPLPPPEHHPAATAPLAQRRTGVPVAAGKACPLKARECRAHTLALPPLETVAQRGWTADGSSYRPYLTVAYR